MKFLHLVLCTWIFSSVSWFTVCGNLKRICILLLCENCINLNYVELVHSGFQVYYIFLLFCLFILLSFESLILKLQLNILTFLMKKMGEGEGGMIWENGIETCIISYMKRIASPGSLHDTGCLGLVH